MVSRLQRWQVVSRLQRWMVMEAPTGQRFCVVRVQRPGSQRMLTAGTKNDLFRLRVPVPPVIPS